MSRPAQLEEQIARVKELQEQVGGDPPKDATNETPEEPVIEQPVVEPPATISKEEYDKLEQRYRTLQGMHTADTTRLRSQLDNAMTAIQDLESRIVEAEQAAKKTPSTPVKHITEEEEEEYGETLDVMRRAAREEAEIFIAKQASEYQERINQLEEQLGYVRTNVVPKVEDLTKSQRDQVEINYWETLSAQVPDWQAVNDNPEFKAWLLAEDPITGANRQQFLSQAHSMFDAPRVIRFFQEWKRIAGGRTPAPNNVQQDLERLIAPGPARGGAANVTPEKKKWTREDIAQFYQDVSSGKYAGKLDERKKIEADIFAAQQDGRYVG